MNELIAGNSETMTMTSREIAELTGKQHKDVLYDIRNMLEKLEIESAQFSADYKDTKGRTYQEFRLDRELTLTLVSGYDIPLRHRVVTRLAELEARPGHPLIPQTLPEALRLAADLADQRNIAQAALALAAPKAEALGRIADAERLMNPTVPEVLREGWGIFPARTRTGGAGPVESGTTKSKAEDFG